MSVTAFAFRSPRQRSARCRCRRSASRSRKEARQRSGDSALTTFEQQAAELAAIRTFITSVVRTEQVTRHVRQITFGGGDLRGFVPAAADQYLYVLAPPPGRRELTIDAGFTWEQYDTMAPDERPIGAYYTVRRWRPDVAELDMLFVLHGDEVHGDIRTGSDVGDRCPTGRPRRPVGAAAAFEPPRTRTGTCSSRTTRACRPSRRSSSRCRREHRSVWSPRSIRSRTASRSSSPTVSTCIGATDEGDRPAGPACSSTQSARCRGSPATRMHGVAPRAAASRRCARYVRTERGLPRTAVSMTGYWRHDDHPDDGD